MEEQKAGSGSPPVPVNASRRPYSDEHRASILKALVTWKGSRRAFCQLQGIHPATLSVWLTQQNHPSKLQSKPKRYNPDQRRQAVEGFLKAGLSFARFSQVWGVNTRCLMRWVAAYRKGGPKALEDQRGKHRLGKPVASGLLDAVKQLRVEFPSFGLRKLSAFLERFKGVKASPGLVRKALDQAKMSPLEPMARRWRNSPVIRRFERARPR